MALTKELLLLLDNKEEPLPKRLKIADNAFKSVELPIQHREAILLKWLGKATKHNVEAWNLLLEWLTSQQMQDLSRNDITREDVQNLINVIIKHTKHCDKLTWNSVVNCVMAVIENRHFQQFFKYDLEMYCKFITNVLYRLEEEAQLYSFLTNEHLFNRNLVSNDEFFKYFMEHCLVCLGCIAEKFQDNKRIFQEISKLIEKCLFHRNFKNFSTFLKTIFNAEADTIEKPSQLPKLLLKNLQKLYDKDDVHPKYVYKLIFHSYCAAYNNNFEIVYKFFILTLETLGFDMHTYFTMNKVKKFQNATSTVDKSITILTALLEVMTENTNELNHKVNEITFTELLQNLTATVMLLTKHPDEIVYQFLHCVIKLDPLIVEKNLSELLVYVMLSNKETTKAQYDEFLVTLFEVFAKLHRIPSLIAKMIPTLKTALEGDFKPKLKVVNFCGIDEDRQEAQDYVISDLISTKTLDCFMHCITMLASWQVINLFKTLVFHLDAAVDTALQLLTDKKIIYIEVISAMMCQFLSSVRIAEHTVSTAVVEKFVKTMEDLKEILGKFGNALVNVEHSPTLMRAYLNICYSWGELYITLSYYSINGEVVLQKTLDNDSSACNITYLHPYLTRDQWCLISQRIANFGEKPCKQIMHKLYIQKLRAMLLFEEAVSDEITSSIRTSILSSIDDNWKGMIYDQLLLDQIVTKSSNLTNIAELVLKDTIETNDFQKLSLLFNCDELIGSMLYVCLRQLKKAFKRKQKRGQPSVKISLTSKVFPYVTEELFLWNTNNSESVAQITEVFVNEIGIESKNSGNADVISCVNEKELSGYLDIIKAIPVVLCDNSGVQQVLILYLTCVLSDLRSSTLQDVELISKCESVIIGLTQNYNGCLKLLIKPFHTMQIIINLFTRYVEIFTLIMRSSLKNEENVELFKDGIEVLTKNIEQERYLQCATVVLNNINKYKKSKFSTENKNRLVEYQEEICRSISKLVKEQAVPDVKQSTEAYALTLKYHLMKNSEDFKELLPFLDGYIKGINNEPVKGAIELFTTILRNKSKLGAVQDDIILKTWSCCQNVNVYDKEHDEYAKLVVLIFEHIPDERFSDIGNDLLRATALKLEENNTQQFIEQLKVWNAILTCNFNTAKTKMWQKILESLLFETILVYLKDDKQVNRESIYEIVVKLEVNIIQNVHFLLTAPLIEAILITVSVMTSNATEKFAKVFGLSISLLENLLKFRKAIIMDYLPTYLQRYRALLNKLCIESNSDLKLQTNDIQQLSDCGHKLEKLTRGLVGCNRHLMRISPYLIADILKQYEERTLFPNVKIHLNNCLYSLMSLCDQHAVSYLMRVLSTAGTEMFKVMYENYRKYYKFTGKV